MLLLPVQCGPDQFDLYMFFDDRSFDRMRAYDPAEVRLDDLGNTWGRMRVRHLRIGYANAEDTRRVQEFIAEENYIGALKFLYRGFRVMPGDHDGPALTLKPMKGPPQ